LQPSATDHAGRRAAHRVELGLRLAYASPGGKAWEDSRLADYVKGAVRAQLDVSYALTPVLSGGAFLGAGLGAAGDRASCEAAGVSCTLFVLDVGFQATARPLARAPVSPWVSLGVGVDLLSQNVSAGSESVTTSAYGPAVGASAGLDLAFGTIALGPYIGYELGWYTSIDVSTENSSTSPDAEIDHKAMHRWLTLGVRGHYELGG
jgi:hypothetical protein